VDNKKVMYFIRNKKDVDNPEAEVHSVEYEVVTDANVIGDLNYGPYRFKIWEFNDKKEGEERKLCLGIREVRQLFSDDELFGSQKQPAYYHGGGIADELVSLSSVFLRRRFKITSTVRHDDNPVMFSNNWRKKWVDKSLIQGQSNLEYLSEWLSQVENLESKYHQKFMLAVKMYHQALQAIEEQPDLAYLSLVSAIEVLCQDTKINKPSLGEGGSNKELVKLLNQIEDENLRNKISKAIVDKDRFISKRFVAFIIENIEDDFWDEPGRPQNGRVEPSGLPKLLAKIYDQRSRTLHNGEPFPVYVMDAPREMDGEIEYAPGRGTLIKTWKQEDYIPYPQFFEKLVNHVLKVFVKKKQAI